MRFWATLLFALVTTTASAQLELKTPTSSVTTWDTGLAASAVRIHALQSDEGTDPAWSVSRDTWVRVAEEPTGDPETSHDTPERIGGADFFDLDPSIGVFGRSTGTTRLSGDVVIASLEQSLEPSAIRAKKVGGAFELFAVDWATNTRQNDVTLSWAVFSEGTHYPEPHLQLWAQSVSGVTHEWITFPAFYGPPVVFATMNSLNGPDRAHVRIRDVGPTSAEIRLEEAEGSNQTHLPETVGFVAVGLRRPELALWVGGCAHWTTGAPPVNRFVNQIADADAAGGFDAFILLGDIGEGCDPSIEHTAIVQEQLAHVAPRPVHAIAGNHDSSETDLDWYNTTVNPVDPWNYALQYGNLKLLMMSDDNTGPTGFGRVCGAGGSGGPSGRWNESQVAWWEAEIATAEIALTATHHSPPRTTIGTGDGDGWRFGAHNVRSPEDRRNDGLLGWGNVTGDGLDIWGNYVGAPDGLREALEANPQHRIWLGAHSHGGLGPGVKHRGRGVDAQLFETAVINASGLSPNHAPPTALWSTLLMFYDGVDYAVALTVFHSDFGGYKGARNARVIDLGVPWVAE